MARLLMGGVLVASISGKAGGVTTITKPTYTTAKARTARVARNSAGQRSAQTAKKWLAYVWSNALRQDQRDAWDVFARTHQFRNAQNKLNTVPMPITTHFGNNLFTALGLNLRTLQHVNLTDPPADLLTSDLINITLTPTPTPPGFQLTHTGTIPPTDYIVISTSIQRPAGATAPRKSNQVITHLYPGDTTQPINLSPGWSAKWGPLRPNALVDVSAYTIRSANGARSPRYTAHLVII